MRNKKILFLSHFFKTLALKISGVIGGKKNVLISFDVKIYREQVHMNLSYCTSIPKSALNLSKSSSMIFISLT